MTETLLPHGRQGTDSEANCRRPQERLSHPRNLLLFSSALREVVFRGSNLPQPARAYYGLSVPCLEPGCW